MIPVQDAVQDFYKGPHEPKISEYWNQIMTYGTKILRSWYKIQLYALFFF